MSGYGTIYLWKFLVRKNSSSTGVLFMMQYVNPQGDPQPGSRFGGIKV